MHPVAFLPLLIFRSVSKASNLTLGTDADYQVKCHNYEFLGEESSCHNVTTIRQSLYNAITSYKLKDCTCDFFKQNNGERWICHEDIPQAKLPNVGARMNDEISSFRCAKSD